MLIFSHSQAVWPSEVKDLSCMSHLFIFGFKVLYKFCLNLEGRQNFILMGFFLLFNLIPKFSPTLKDLSDLFIDELIYSTDYFY